MQKKSRLNGWLTDPAPSASRLQRKWLTQSGALTQGLRTLGALTLRVLSENVCRASPDEAARLNLPIGHALWKREVCMSILEVDCVVARSVTPLAAAQGQWQAIRRLRNRPLADILYHDRAIARSAFEFTTLKLGMPLYHCSQITPTPGQRVIARRSVFMRTHQPLLVAEAFLPAFWLMSASTNVNTQDAPHGR